MVGEATITATLKDSKTTQDFVSPLPLTLTMNELFGREKFAHLPRAISKGGKRTRAYQVGALAYWPSAPAIKSNSGWTPRDVSCVRRKRA
jgi:hypothetical protein